MADEHDDYRKLDARPPWFLRFLARRVVPVAIVALLVGAVVFFRSYYEDSDRHYGVYVSIQQAEMLAMSAHFKARGNGQFPARLSDLRVSDMPDSALKDVWGKPYRYAVVPNEAGELEPFVWTERTDKKGRTTIIGAKVRPNGSVVRFGLPDD